MRNNLGICWEISRIFCSRGRLTRTGGGNGLPDAGTKRSSIADSGSGSTGWLADCRLAYATFEFHRFITILLIRFRCRLSSLYIELTKDRMYCGRAGFPAVGAQRRQVLREILTRCVPGTRASFLLSPPREAWRPFKGSRNFNGRSFARNFSAGWTTRDNATLRGRKLWRLRGITRRRSSVQRPEKLMATPGGQQGGFTFGFPDVTEKVLRRNWGEEFFLVSETIRYGERRSEYVSVTQNAVHKVCACWR